MKPPSKPPLRQPQPMAPSLPDPPAKPGAPAHDRDVRILTHLIWKRDGAPLERRRHYRREVDLQLRATRHLLERELTARG